MTIIGYKFMAKTSNTRTFYFVIDQPTGMSNEEYEKYCDEILKEVDRILASTSLQPPTHSNS